jgi:ribosome-associated protein
VIDVRGISSVTDFFVIATAQNGPHLKALSGVLDDSVTQTGGRHPRRSGAPESGWIVCDCMQVVIHLLTADRREFYGLEQLWQDAPRIA